MLPFIIIVVLSLAGVGYVVLTLSKETAKLNEAAKSPPRNPFKDIAKPEVKEEAPDLTQSLSASELAKLQEDSPQGEKSALDQKDPENLTIPEAPKDDDPNLMALAEIKNKLEEKKDTRQPFSTDEDNKRIEITHLTTEINSLNEKYKKLDDLFNEKSLAFDTAQKSLENEISNRKDFNKVKEVLEAELTTVKTSERKAKEKADADREKLEETNTQLEQEKEQKENLQKSLETNDEEKKVLEQKLNSLNEELTNLKTQALEKPAEETPQSQEEIIDNLEEAIKEAEEKIQPAEETPQSVEDNLPFESPAKIPPGIIIEEVPNQSKIIIKESVVIKTSPDPSKEEEPKPQKEESAQEVVTEKKQSEEISLSSEPQKSTIEEKKEDDDDEDIDYFQLIPDLEEDPEEEPEENEKPKEEQ